MLTFERFTHEDAPDMNIHGARDVCYTYVISGPHDYRRAWYIATANGVASGLEAIGAFATLEQAIEACQDFSKRRTDN